MVKNDIYKEQNLKEDKYFHIQESYVHNFQTPCLTNKFYSKYEGNLTDCDPKILEEVRRREKYGPKEKYPSPVTTSMEYGWYAPYMERDKRFYFNSTSSPYTKIMLDLMKQNKTEKKFAGVPFLLQ
ncbi:unnamed protein product [Brassicogethes aeneus]|uniref:Uncharacterized protein n=1 Tax=Brassicogethes aeneus TaxID=1431903 RepID=A0A9P0FL94_BRAAE|nr:unnamed protein product [Brassicogethes aeneus]